LGEILKGEITERVIDRRTRIKLGKTPTFISHFIMTIAQATAAAT
jgi:hypothetical protein